LFFFPVGFFVTGAGAVSAPFGGSTHYGTGCNIVVPMMNDGSRVANTPARGRRPHIAAEDVARVAIDLFSRQGYDAVSMDEIASAANVSRRSLFRYFPSKSDLVWAGFAPYLDRLMTGLERTPEGTDPLMAVQAALVDALPSEAAGVAAMRVQLAIVESHPDLWSTGSSSLVAAHDIVQQFLSDRTVFGGLRVRVFADLAITTAFTALRFWSTADEAPVRRIVEDAFAALGDWGGTRP
jgi:AcrR family transcriptional regulator